MLKINSTIAVRKQKITQAFDSYEQAKENFLICIDAKISYPFY